MVRNAKRVQGWVNEWGDVVVEAVRSDPMEEDSGAVPEATSAQGESPITMEDAAITMAAEAHKHEQDVPAREEDDATEVSGEGAKDEVEVIVVDDEVAYVNVQTAPGRVAATMYCAGVRIETLPSSTTLKSRIFWPPNVRLKHGWLEL
ncbi:hypothetical protein PI124_g24282 [Phytophthora idaei]|nr:hypothetical protein PI126_g24342 [Phytophthora idaei]KAG3230620.1 hypothetical protein PI124_g24282 [Phytophthora idaei]